MGFSYIHSPTTEHQGTEFKPKQEQYEKTKQTSNQGKAVKRRKKKKKKTTIIGGKTEAINPFILEFSFVKVYVSHQSEKKKT